MKLFGKAKKDAKLENIEHTLKHSHRGIFKQIDENRELLELLYKEAPDLINKYPGITSWLTSKDAFLNELAEVASVEKGNYVDQKNYPRPFPQNPFDICVANIEDLQEVDIKGMAEVVRNEMSINLHGTILEALQEEAKKHGWLFVRTEQAENIPFELRNALREIIWPTYINLIRPALKFQEVHFEKGANEALDDGWSGYWLDSVLGILREQGIRPVMIDKQ